MTFANYVTGNDIRKLKARKRAEISHKRHRDKEIENESNLKIRILNNRYCFIAEKYDRDIDDQVNKFHRTVAGTPCGGVFCCSMFTGQPERILPHKTFSSNGGKKSVQDPPVLTVSGLDARFSATMGKADGYLVDTQTNFDFFSVDDILYIRILCGIQ